MKNHPVTLKRPEIAIATLTVAIALTLLQPATANKTIVEDVDCIVQPSVITDLGVGVAGVLEAIHVSRGDYVETGSVVAQLEADVERATQALAQKISSINSALAVRQYNASFGLRTLKRNQQLYEKASISTQTLDQVKTESQIAQMQVQQEQENSEIAKLESERAKAAVERRIIRSSLDGVVTEQYKTVGEYVSDDPVLQVVQLDPLRVDIVLPLEFRGSIGNKMRADVVIQVPGFENDIFPAHITSVDPVADAASGTFGVSLEIANPEFKIPSGVRCTLDIHAQ